MKEYVEKVQKQAEAVADSLRRLRVVYRLITELTLDPTNPRVHPPHQIRQIARSIEVFGFIVPVLINAQDVSSWAMAGCARPRNLACVKCRRFV